MNRTETAGRGVHSGERGQGSLGSPLKLRRVCLQKGFLYSFEAATALILLIISAATLQLYEVRPHAPGDFFLCSDAAAVLAKSGHAPSALRARADELHSLSGLCIMVDAGAASASSCAPYGGEKISLTIPVWEGGVQSMRVGCWREK